MPKKAKTKGAKALFTVNLQFGLVNIPVKAVTLRRSKSISFKRVCSEGHAIKNKYFCPDCNREYEYKEFKKGYQVADEMLVFDKEILKNIEDLNTENIEILGYKKIEDIDSRGFDSQYYLVPDGKYTKTFTLFRETLEKSGRCALVKYTVRNKTHLGIIKPFKNVLNLINLYYPDEIVQVPELKEEKLSKDEIDLGLKLIESLADKKIDENELVDEFREKVETLIEDTLAGKPIKIEKIETVATKTEDLKSLLEKSLLVSEKLG